MSARAHHEEWLSLVEISGPFVSPMVLDRVFPSGLPMLDGQQHGDCRLAYREWSEMGSTVGVDDPLHDEWIRYVLTAVLGLDDRALRSGEDVRGEITVQIPERTNESLEVDFAVVELDVQPSVEATRMLITKWDRDQALHDLMGKSDWAASPIDRMVYHCRSLGVRLGLVTNGEQWILVDAPIGETSATVTWYANLWFEEPITMRAFRAMLGAQRFFGVAEEQRLVAMLEESAAYQDEVTEQLGAQVRRAIEVLTQALDRADIDTGRRLLKNVSEAELYSAAVTVMMRLVFLFSAEERGLLLLGHPIYDQYYAASPLRGQLREDADRLGIEVLERRQDAWCRLLATFRALYGGLDLDRGDRDDAEARIPAYGGSLFDPDRFPFLEGRAPGSRWRDTPATPLPVDNRTVLLLLESLQLLKTRKRSEVEAPRLSFRALDIEQIGHVYESLLDHQALRATEAMISLQGNQGLEPEVPVSKLTQLREDSPDGLTEYLKVQTKKSKTAIENALVRELDPKFVGRLRTACGGDESLFEEVLPFHDLIRVDPWGEPVVIRQKSVYVTESEERRATGTYYTPRVLTEEIVEHALTPLAYDGRREGKGREEWLLRAPEQLLKLKICDPAMGSGAFLVQACRWLSERLVEAWEFIDTAGPLTIEGRPSRGEPSEILIPNTREERLALARRLVAERCLYGVDVNPLAVEMAKLSLWLITLARRTAFTFLDHALKCGDSLIGIHDVEQLTKFHLDPKRGEEIHGTLIDHASRVREAVEDATAQRERLQAFTVRDSADSVKKAGLHRKAEGRLRQLRVLADVVVASGWSAVRDGERPDRRLVDWLRVADLWLESNNDDDAYESLMAYSVRALNEGRPEGKPDRRPFHWPIEFPEVLDQHGFDAMVGNPPFMGNTYWKSRLGTDFSTWAEVLLQAKPGKMDLCVLFLRRCFGLVAADGTVGLIQALNVRSGASASHGTERVAEEAVIYCSRVSVAWPGTASVRVNIVWFSREWEGEAILDGEHVDRIDGWLRPSREGLDIQPKELEGGIWAFGGSDNSRGRAFVMEEGDPWLDRLREENSPYLRRYVNGKDLTNQSLQLQTRWCIDTLDSSLQEVLLTSPATREFLFDRVKPTRSREALTSYKGLYERWWQFWNHRADLYHRLRKSDRCYVSPKVSKYLVVVPGSTKHTYTDKVRLIEAPPQNQSPILFSDLIDIWVWRFSARMGLQISLSKAAFATFPLPVRSISSELETDWLENLFFLAEEQGSITRALNAFHDPGEKRGLVNKLRGVREEINRQSFEAYGWNDLELELAFEDTEPGLRLTFPMDLQLEVLARLLELNHQRHEEEHLSVARI